MIAVQLKEESVRRTAMVEKRPIKKLTVEGFKSIRKMELKLDKLNILIGPNGAGKSNLVSYFHMLRELVEGRLVFWVGKQGGANRLLTFGVKETPQLYSHIEFGENAYGFRLEHAVGDRFVFEDEDLSYGYKHPLGSGHQESLLKSQLRADSTESPRRADYSYASISSWKVFHFHDTSDRARIMYPGALNDNRYLRPDASNLAAYLYMLKKKHRDVYDQICQIVRLAIPFFGDFILEPNEIGPGDSTIRLEWRQQNHDYPFLPVHLSDGSLRFICLVTVLLQPDPPATIIIDEPELGLHPYAITLLGALMRSASERMQIIVATQSVSLINQFSIDDLVVVELEDDVSVFKRLNEEDFALWLEDYTVGELWEKNVLGGRLPI